MNTHIPFLSPSFPEVEDVAADYAAIVASRRFSNGGPFEQRFSKELKQWIGASVGASVVSSGTTGLQLAVAATFESERPLALVASFTFAAGPLVLRRCGYRPAFIDIEGDTWHPRVADAKAFLEHNAERTAGILLTNTFGVANESMDDWEALAERFALPLVIDSAAGFGSEYSSGERLGARGTCEVFSFHATKTLAVGEGGVVTSRDLHLVDRLECMKNFGFDAARSAVELGTNAKLDELSCAIGIRQLAALQDRLAKRRQILDWYRDSLKWTDVTFQPGARRSALPFVSALFPTTGSRQETLVQLQAAQVEARTYYNPPVHEQRVFLGSQVASPEMDTTTNLASRIVSLPMYDEMTFDEVRRIAGICQAACHAQPTSSS